MATKFKGRYHVPQSDNDTSLFEKDGGDGGEYTTEALGALLAPTGNTYCSDQGPEPGYSDKALIVMAIFGLTPGRVDAKRIISWIKDNFKNPRFRTRRYMGVILKILNSDDDFIPDNLDDFEDDDHRSSRFFWTHRPGLQRLLRSMRDTNGDRFSPDQHVTRHTNMLKNSWGFGGPVSSRNPLRVEQLSASNVSTLASHGHERGGKDMNRGTMLQEWLNSPDDLAFPLSYGRSIGVADKPHATARSLGGDLRLWTRSTTSATSTLIKAS